jgi:hypothetical protein
MTVNTFCIRFGHYFHITPAISLTTTTYKRSSQALFFHTKRGSRDLKPMARRTTTTLLFVFPHPIPLSVHLACIISLRAPLSRTYKLKPNSNKKAPRGAFL